MEQPELPLNGPYPSQPGWKRTRTSKAAAETVKPYAKTLRDQVLELLRDASLTADECAAALGKSVLSIRPRLSELVAQSKIYDTGRTGKNASGIMATIWKAHDGA